MILAHGLSTISAADLIIVLHEGKLPKWEDMINWLLQRYGRYAAMWTKQNRAVKAGSGEAENSLACDGVTVPGQTLNEI